MGKKKGSKKLSAKDFSGDGEPYAEVEVRISIRILGGGITRSRLAVTVFPDPALEGMAKESLKKLKKESYGYNEEGVFAACLAENFNGWEDIEGEYPRIAEEGKKPGDAESLKCMNEDIKGSVEWALEMNKKGMEEASRNSERREPGTTLLQ